VNPVLVPSHKFCTFIYTENKKKVYYQFFGAKLILIIRLFQSLEDCCEFNLVHWIFITFNSACSGDFGKLIIVPGENVANKKCANSEVRNIRRPKMT